MTSINTTLFQNSFQFLLVLVNSFLLPFLIIPSLKRYFPNILSMVYSSSEKPQIFS